MSIEGKIEKNRTTNKKHFVKYKEANSSQNFTQDMAKQEEALKEKGQLDTREIICSILAFWVSLSDPPNSNPKAHFNFVSLLRRSLNGPLVFIIYHVHYHFCKGSCFAITLVIESVSDLVADDNTDGSVVQVSENLKFIKTLYLTLYKFRGNIENFILHYSPFISYSSTILVLPSSLCIALLRL
jgi:hypothetical protein